MAVMNKNLQIYKLKKELKKYGIEPDTVDLEALVDPTLTYKENKANIFKQLGISPGQKAIKKEDEIREIIKQAQYYHEQRSERAKAVDEARLAKIPEDPELWFKYPGKYDLPGVDAPGTVEEYIKFLRYKPQAKERLIEELKRKEPAAVKKQYAKPKIRGKAQKGDDYIISKVYDYLMLYEYDRYFEEMDKIKGVFMLPVGPLRYKNVLELVPVSRGEETLTRITQEEIEGLGKYIVARDELVGPDYVEAHCKVCRARDSEVCNERCRRPLAYVVLLDIYIYKIPKTIRVIDSGIVTLDEEKYVIPRYKESLKKYNVEPGYKRIILETKRTYLTPEHSRRDIGEIGPEFCRSFVRNNYTWEKEMLYLFFAEDLKRLLRYDRNPSFVAIMDVPEHLIPAGFTNRFMELLEA